MLDKLSGYKTYIVVALTFGYSVYMGVTGAMPWLATGCEVMGCTTVVDYLLGGGALGAVRSALKTIGL